MKLFLATVLLSFALPASGQNYPQETQCKGVVHGVVLRQNGQPVGDLNVVLFPIGVDLAIVLPQMKTDQQGEYRFEHVCPGRYSVLVEDEKAGYPLSSPYLNWFLYGTRVPEVKITDVRSDAHLTVNVPPKPAQLQVRLTNSRTKAKIARVDVELKANRKRTMKTYCDESQYMSCDSEFFFLVPPGEDVFLHVTSNGFQEWKESAGRGKLIHVRPGEVLTINVELDPIQN